jgi:DNA-binding GntR family transcriptional regulator
MATVDIEVSKSLFRPQRYPALRAIVEAERESPRSLADEAVEMILKQIIRGELPSGARLKTTELGERLGMSRTPVTKALAKLSSEGILSQPNNFQAIVTPGAANWLVQTHELRQLLEPEAARRAAGRLPVEVLDDLWVLSRDAKPTRKHEWVDAAQYFDFALHLAIAEFCGNVPMKVSIRKCWMYKWLSYELSDGCLTALKPEYAQHLAILSAIAEGDAERAQDEMAKHLQTASVNRFSPRVV